MVKTTPLLATPATVTTTLPVVAPAGTGTTMLVALQLVGVAAVPLNVTVPVPCVAPKFVPVIVTGVAMAALAGEIPEIEGVGRARTQNDSAGAAMPATDQYCVKHPMFAGDQDPLTDQFPFPSV
jgi:hypothetical protein